ncbi:MAG: large conductance mechanosensitive channel protein MscL [Candidatus Nanopelagicales bacterium]
MSNGKTGLIKGFKEFIMRGNVIDLAIAVVVGAAFGAVVKAFTDYVINPVLASVGGGDTAGWGFYIRSGNEATFVDIGAVFGAVLQFLITMAVVYYVFVVPMNKARSLSKAEPKVAPTPPDIVLLTEIRDLLMKQGEQPPATPGAPGPRA